MRRIEHVVILWPVALWIEGTSVRLTERTGMRLTAPVWIEGVGMRLIEVHC